MGSLGHPFDCTPCCFELYLRGKRCLRGVSCHNCHAPHLKRANSAPQTLVRARCMLTDTVHRTVVVSPSRDQRIRDAVKEVQKWKELRKQNDYDKEILECARTAVANGHVVTLFTGDR